MTISTDELVKEMQVRLDRGEIGYEGLFSSVQSNYRDIVFALNQWLWDQMNTSHELFERYNPVIIKLEELYKSVPSAPPPSSVNTTLYGRENEI